MVVTVRAEQPSAESGSSLTERDTAAGRTHVCAPSTPDVEHVDGAVVALEDGHFSCALLTRCQVLLSSTTSGTLVRAYHVLPPHPLVPLVGLRAASAHKALPSAGPARGWLGSTVEAPKNTHEVPKRTLAGRMPQCALACAPPLARPQTEARFRRPDLSTNVRMSGSASPPVPNPCNFLQIHPLT
jgi:hypothetical protein